MKILILGGFLGSGKTTLLLQLARYLVEQSNSASEHKIVIVENEVGKEGVDDKLLRGSGLQVESLFNGCICCSLAGEIVPMVVEVEKAYNPDWLIIETTGLAYPGLIQKNLKEAIHRESIICTVVDASRWKRFLVPMHELLKGQIESAHVVLINKMDLVDEAMLDEIEEDIHEFQKDATCIRTSAQTAVDSCVWETIREVQV